MLFRIYGDTDTGNDYIAGEKEALPLASFTATCKSCERNQETKEEGREEGRKQRQLTYQVLLSCFLLLKMEINRIMRKDSVESNTDRDWLTE